MLWHPPILIVIIAFYGFINSGKFHIDWWIFIVSSGTDQFEYEKLQKTIFPIFSAEALKCYVCSSDKLETCSTLQMIQGKELPSELCPTNVASCFTKIESKFHKFFICRSCHFKNMRIVRQITDEAKLIQFFFCFLIISSVCSWSVFLFLWFPNLTNIINLLLYFRWYHYTWLLSKPLRNVIIDVKRV